MKEVMSGPINQESGAVRSIKAPKALFLLFGELRSSSPLTILGPPNKSRPAPEKKKVKKEVGPSGGLSHRTNRLGILSPK